jgi:hypothetical protein
MPMPIEVMDDSEKSWMAAIEALDPRNGGDVQPLIDKLYFGDGVIPLNCRIFLGGLLDSKRQREFGFGLAVKKFSKARRGRKPKWPPRHRMSVYDLALYLEVKVARAQSTEKSRQFYESFAKPGRGRTTVENICKKVERNLGDPSRWFERLAEDPTSPLAKAIDQVLLRQAMDGVSTRRLTELLEIFTKQNVSNRRPDKRLKTQIKFAQKIE